MTAMVRAAGVKGYPELMRALGTDPRPLLEKHGLPADCGENDEALLPAERVVALLEESAAATGRADFGLRLAACQDIRVLGPLAAAMQHSATVGEALATLARYLFVQSPALVFAIVEDRATDEVELRVDVVLPRQPRRRQVLDLCLGDLHRILEFLARGQHRLRAVALPHSPAASLRVYEKFFGAPVLVDQEHGGLRVDRGTLRAGLGAVNPSLREIALDYMNRHYADPTQSTETRVRRALGATLSTTNGGKSAIASLLFVHPRTLQRKLAAEGVRFEDLRDEVRRASTLRFLRESEIPLAQIASLVGLADQSVLTRCCVRWFGETPSRIRRAAPATIASAP
jgi:AraC-like DNA-binding protein